MEVMPYRHNIQIALDLLEMAGTKMHKQRLAHFGVFDKRNCTRELCHEKLPGRFIQEKDAYGR